MDLFFAGCQGLGLALAAGVFSGASGRRGAIGAALLAVAAIAGAALWGLSFSENDHPAWAGIVLGAAFAAFAFFVARDFAEGAQRRTEGGGATGALIALGALVLAGLSLLVSPIALVALAGLAWVYAGRSRRAGRKYEGLRTLR